MRLAEQQCIPCRGGVPPLAGLEAEGLLGRLSSGWSIEHGHHLHKTYRLKNFAQALELVNAIGALAEEQRHHPDITLAWGKVEVRIWTHKIDGLTESDFVLADKCEVAAEPLLDDHP